MAPPDSPSSSSSDKTRDNLISAGLHLFGAQGFAATSTRQIAARAGPNVASIAYHFGGKVGLHEACGRAVADRMAATVGEPRHHAELTAREAASMIEAMIRNLVRFVTAAPAATDIVAFLLGEIRDHGPAADLIYSRFVGPKHSELCALWAAATGRDAESEAVKIAVFALVGQIVYFRIGQPFVLKRMGWDHLTEAEAARIADVLVDQLHASLERGRE